MKGEDFFKNTITKKIWDQYDQRLQHILRRTDKEEKKELLLEIKSHLLESFKQDPAESEEEKLLNAIDRLGEPEIFLRPLIADRYMTRASRTLSPKDVARGLYFSLFTGFKKAVISFLLGLGYILAFIFAVMAVLKPFLPNNVGVLLFNDGSITAGMAFNSSGVKTDYFGYWIIPISAALAVLIYIGLTKYLRKVRRSRAGDRKEEF
ncbi:MAG: hypothetical protein JSV46_11220 [Candidatus Aminicenantes bacterium]|nr:MAG: hypothetical protein JSV46_11220 [Candidatus Aminicenantes bacterium]